MCVANFLNGAGLSSYVDAFLAEGILAMSDVQLLSESNLKDFGLNMGERNRFKEHLKIYCSTSCSSTCTINSTHNNHYLPPTNDGPGATSVCSYVNPSESRYVTPPRQTQTEPDASNNRDEEFNEIFNAIDADGNGEIDLQEFIVALKKMDMYRSDIDAIRIFNEGANDDNFTLGRDEFIQMLHLAPSSDEHGTELAEMTKAGKDVLDKLKASWGVSFAVEDVMDAPITELALEAVSTYSNESLHLVPKFDSCTEANCNLFFNAVVLNSELASKLIETLCLVMLEDLENKLRECGISDFLSKFVQDEVVKDAVRTFMDITHRYSHLTNKDQTYLESKAGLAFIHSFRKAACVVAAERSVDEVRQNAINTHEDQMQESKKDNTSMVTEFGKGFVKGGAGVLCEELFVAALGGAAATGCTIM